MHNVNPTVTLCQQLVITYLNWEIHIHPYDWKDVTNTIRWSEAISHKDKEILVQSYDASLVDVWREEIWVL